MDESSGGALTGAAQGASAGAVFGPWGAVIGAVIGGVVGLVSGQNKKIAKKYAGLAAEQKRKQQSMELALQRRDIVRQQRAIRAQAIAAGESEPGVVSSSIQGSQSSVQSQGMSSLQYFDAQVGSDNLYQTYAKKAGKYARKAGELDSILGSASSITGIAADVYGTWGKSSTTAAPKYNSFNNQAAPVNLSQSTGFATFGSTLNLGP